MNLFAKLNWQVWMVLIILFWIALCFIVIGLFFPYICGSL